MPGLVRPKSKEVPSLPLARRPWLDRGRVVRFNIRPERISDSDKKAYEPYFPPKINSALRSDAAIDVPEFLSICDGSPIEVFVSAYDSFSGAKSFARRSFSSDDFRDGPFSDPGTDQVGGYQEDGLDELLSARRPESTNLS